MYMAVRSISNGAMILAGLGIDFADIVSTRNAESDGLCAS